jgi:hypothetical protein
VLLADDFARVVEIHRMTVVQVDGGDQAALNTTSVS